MVESNLKAPNTPNIPSQRFILSQSDLNSLKHSPPKIIRIFTGDWDQGLPDLTRDFQCPIKLFKNFELYDIFTDKMNILFRNQGFYFGGLNSEGQLNEYGTQLYKNGLIYKGNYKEGSWHYYGELYLNGQMIYAGNMFRGNFEGEGVFINSKGEHYEGWFQNSLPSGKGIMYYPNNEVVEGVFVKGVAHGRGVLTTQYGDQFEGDFKGGKLDGMVLIYKRGKQICKKPKKQEFRNGLPILKQRKKRGVFGCF